MWRRDFETVNDRTNNEETRIVQAIELLQMTSKSPYCVAILGTGGPSQNIENVS